MKTEEEIVVFCQNIKKLRESHHLSKRSMASKLGVGIRTLISIESGVLPPRVGCSVLKNIHEHFGVLPKNMFQPLVE